MYLQLKKRKSWLIWLALSFSLLSCSEIRLIGAYDQTIDEGIQKVSKDVSTLLVRLEKNELDGSAAANAYVNFRETYIEIEGEVKMVKIRAGALSKYEKVKAQIDLVEQNIQSLELLHKSGFSLPGKTPVQVIQATATLFEVAFTSMQAAQNALKREKVETK